MDFILVITYLKIIILIINKLIIFFIRLLFQKYYFKTSVSLKHESRTDCLSKTKQVGNTTELSLVFRSKSFLENNDLSPGFKLKIVQGRHLGYRVVYIGGLIFLFVSYLFVLYYN